MLTNKKVILITVLTTILSISIFAQDDTIKQDFHISANLKYKDFNFYMKFQSICRVSAEVTFIEKTTIQDRTMENECVLLFDNNNCKHRRYNLLRKQDSLQYICDGYLLYTISHKTKELTIESAEKGIELMKNNPFVYFYSYPGYLLYPNKKKNIDMLVNKEFVVLNYFNSKASILYNNGYYSSTFRTCDLALSEQKCLLKNENGTTNLYDVKLISLENENVNNFTEKDFDASQWYDDDYTIVDKRSTVVYSDL